ncbi:MAG: hypothetical protein Q7T50_06100 [Candidatus Magasanikbacteria bacterium]|nr:hypothetical protein [Candidatus Magasanikbacteria bacterium]
MSVRKIGPEVIRSKEEELECPNCDARLEVIPGSKPVSTADNAEFHECPACGRPVTVWKF